MQQGKPSAKFIAPSLFCPTPHFYKPIISTSFFYNPISEHMSCFLQIIMHLTDSYIAKLQAKIKCFKTWTLHSLSISGESIHTVPYKIYISVAHCYLELMTVTSLSTRSYYSQCNCQLKFLLLEGSTSPKR